MKYRFFFSFLLLSLFSSIIYSNDYQTRLQSLKPKIQEDFKQLRHMEASYKEQCMSSRYSIKDNKVIVLINKKPLCQHFLSEIKRLSHQIRKQGAECNRLFKQAKEAKS